MNNMNETENNLKIKISTSLQKGQLLATDNTMIKLK